MPLADEVAAFHEGRPNPAALIGEFRRTVVILPIVDDAFLAADLDGIRWRYAFSDRNLDVLLPAVEGPAGVALDAGSAQGMLFPPVSGIVPDRVAVDGDNGISAPSPVGAQGSATHV